MWSMLMSHLIIVPQKIQQSIPPTEGANTQTAIKLSDESLWDISLESKQLLSFNFINWFLILSQQLSVFVLISIDSYGQ